MQLQHPSRPLGDENNTAWTKGPCLRGAVLAHASILYNHSKASVFYYHGDLPEHALPTIATLCVAGREVAKAVVVTIIRAPDTDRIMVPLRVTVVIVVELFIWLMFVVVDKHILKRVSYT